MGREMLVFLRQRIVSRYGSLGAFCKVVQIKQPQLSKIIYRQRKLKLAEQERWAKILGADRRDLFQTGPEHIKTILPRVLEGIKKAHEARNENS